MKGYTGQILQVDLTTKTSKVIKIKDEIYEQLLSGAGLGAWWCYNHIPAGADPMSPENVVCFTTGIMTCTGATIMGRWMVITKSPSTGGIGEANCGGSFAPGIKHCGFDMIAIHGKADKPVYLYIDNKGCQILDAEGVWGLDCHDAEEELWRRHTQPGKKRPVCAVIGPGGEKQGWMAGVCNENGRIAARQGVGGVIGSKNLKGIVCNGTKPVSGIHTEEIKALAKQCAGRLNMAFLPPEIPTGLLNITKVLPELQLSPDGLLTAVLMGTWGTAGASQFTGQTGEGPIRNWGGTQKEHFSVRQLNKTDAHQMLKHQVTRYYCYSCSYGCGGELDISKIKHNDAGYSIVHKPEYESQWDYTAFLLNDDNDAMLYINEYLNRQGIDAISCGGCVGMAIECVEHGILTREDVGGLNLTWGNADAIIEFVKMICEQRGIGEVFSHGTRYAAKVIGKGSEKFAVQGGGMEPPMHDSRLDPQQATLYAIDPTPARHTSGGSLYYGCMHIWKKVSWAPAAAIVGDKSGESLASEEEALKVLACAYYKRLIDGAGGCYFGMITGVGNYPVFEWLNAATGWTLTPDEYMVIGKRIFTLRQMFNIKHGKMPLDNRPHDRMVGDTPHKVGKTAGTPVPIDALLRKTWETCGYDPDTGVPLDSTLEELGLPALMNMAEEVSYVG